MAVASIRTASTRRLRRVAYLAVGALALVVLAAGPAAAATWSFEDLDGNGVPGGNGRTTSTVGRDNAVLLYQGQPHVWSRDQLTGRLRHSWWNGTQWSFEDLDGPGVPGGNGRTTEIVAGDIAVALYQGQPHLWYRDNASRLRHAWWTGTQWSFESLDGIGVPGGNGRTEDQVGFFNAVTLYQGQPHVWYRDATVGRLRHAWWTGTQWSFEDLDGPGVPGSNGRTTDVVAADNAVTVYQGQPHVWYRDGFGRLRHAWWTGSQWSFESLDGPGVPGGNGRTGDQVGFFNAVTLYQGQPHVWYRDATAGRLRHAWWTGTQWSFEDLDGPTVPGGNGRTDNQVGAASPVTLYQGQPHVWYQDVIVGRLRHAWWTGSQWSFEDLDGPGVPGANGRTANLVGFAGAVTLYQGQPHVWYLDATANRLRHAWWG